MRGSGLQSLCISTIAPGRAGAAKHRTCESGHPWRSDVGSYDSREGGGRVAPGAATESNARLHGKDCSRQSLCISSIHGGQMQELEQRREQLPRTASGTAVEDQLPVREGRSSEGVRGKIRS